METLPSTLLLGLEDLAADFAHARRHQHLGRLALLCYCELRPWARRASEARLAELAWSMCVTPPAQSRDAFVCRVDKVIDELEDVCRRAGQSIAADSLKAARVL